MNLTKRGSVWWVDFRLPSGRRVRRTTEKTDRIEAAKVASAIVSAALVEAEAPAAVLTLAGALDRQHREHWSRMAGERVMRHTIAAIVRKVGDLPVTAVDYDVLKKAGEEWLSEGLAPATINRRMSAVGVALRECARRKEIPARPDLPHYREDNRKERYMTVEEERAVFEWLKCKSMAEAYTPGAVPAYTVVRLLAVVLIDTGLRFSEALKATRDGDVLDLRHGQTKTGAGRRVPLTARAAQAWDALGKLPLWFELRGRRPDDAWAWCSYRWDQATAAAGCPDVTLHILRHTCASRLVQRGVPIFTVSKWLGHSSVKVTERYAKLAPDSLSQALAALEGKPVEVERLQDTRTVQECEESTGLGHRDVA